jgi:hypothetical protein
LITIFTGDIVARHDYDMADSTLVLTTEYTRLHITPLNPNLLTAILPPSILPNARNISYHTVQTFPEKAYGYLELPKMDADKIKKKLNGSILKGTKVIIETAKPKKELVLEEEEKAPAKPKGEKDSKKRKRGQETVPAAEIGDRSVKRGWTTPAAAIGKWKKDKAKDEKKSVVKSKYTTGPECLFKTVLPPNVAVHTKSKDGRPEKKNRKSDKETVVHEFSKTTKYATFLRGPAGSNKTKATAEFIEGKGWVDEDGNVVEEVVVKNRKSQKEPKPVEVEPETSTSEDESSEVSSLSEEEDEDEETSSATLNEVAPNAEPVEEDSPTSSSGSSSEEEEEEEEETSPAILKAVAPNAQPVEEESLTSSSGSSSEEESESEASSSSEDESDAEYLEEGAETPIATSHPQSGQPSGLNIKVPEPPSGTTPVSTEVHPLEALYKRPRRDTDHPSPKAAPSSFSFFGAASDNEDIEDEESQDQVPMTPFTQKEFEYRGIRSAAPTPDTSHANKQFIWPADNQDEEDEEDEEARSPTRKELPAKTTDAKAGNSAESDFQKWFYENRGDTNRAWKKRRKVVAKENRQRENRKRNDRTF